MAITTRKLLMLLIDRLVSKIHVKILNDTIYFQKSYLSEIPSGTSSNELNIVVTLKDSNVELDIDTPENYTLKISKNGQNLLAR